MAFLLLLRETTDISAATPRFEVRRYVHNTVTMADEAQTAYTTQDPGPFDLDPAVKAGEYCRGTSLVEVYHSAYGAVSSALITTANAPGCAVLPPPVSPTARLLYRADTGTNAGDIQRNAFYYDAGTHTAFEVGPTKVSAALPVFSLDPTILLGAFCLAPGLAPFTERRFYHAGLGALRFEDVDNVTTCRFSVADLTLTVTQNGDETGAGGDGFVVLTAGGAGPGIPLTYSLDGFRTETPTLTAGFTRLRAGQYLASVREEVTGGRRASVAFRINAPRGLRYTVPFLDRDNVPYLAELHLRGYVGPATELRGTSEPLRLNYPGAGGAAPLFAGPVRGSEAELAVLVQRDGEELAALYVIDERAMRLDVRAGSAVPGAGALVWRGFGLPDLFDAPLIAPPYALTLRFTDGLGTLKSLPLGDAAGNALPPGWWSQRRLVQHILSLLDTDLPLASVVNLRPASLIYGAAGAPAAEYTPASSDALGLVGHATTGFVDDKDKPWTCEKTLTAILASYDAQLLQWGGAWHLRRLHELVPGVVTARWHAPSGAALVVDAPAPLLRTVGLPPPNAGPENLFYLDAAQAVSLVPAAGEVVLTTDPGKMLNLLPDAEGWPLAAFTRPGGRLQQWFGTLPHARVTSKDGAALQVQTGAMTDALQSPNFTTSFPVVVRLKATLRGLPPPPPLTPTTSTGPNYLYAFTALANGAATRVEVMNGIQRGPNFAAGTLEFTAVDKPTEATFLLEHPAGVSGFAAVTYALQLLPANAGTVEIEELRVEVGAEIVAAGTGLDHLSYVSEYRHTPTQGGRNTGTDKAELLIFDTPNAIFTHTPVLLALTEPVNSWQETPGDGPLELGDFLGRDRVLWQTRPARALRCTLRGAFSPLNLLTDPRQPAPAVYVPTAFAWRVADAEVELTAVENLLLIAPLPAGLPLALLLSEAGQPLLDEAGTHYLLAQYAN